MPSSAGAHLRNLRHAHALCICCLISHHLDDVINLVHAGPTDSGNGINQSCGGCPPPAPCGSCCGNHSCCNLGSTCRHQRNGRASGYDHPCSSRCCYALCSCVHGTKALCAARCCISSLTCSHGLPAERMQGVHGGTCGRRSFSRHAEADGKGISLQEVKRCRQQTAWRPARCACAVSPCATSAEVQAYICTLTLHSGVWAPSQLHGLQLHSTCKPDVVGTT